MVLIDMAWRLNPDVRVFTLDTGRLPPETYTLFEEVRERYGIAVEFEYPDTDAVAALVNREGPNLMYRGVDLRLACCAVRKVEPLRRKLATLDAWVAGLRREQWASRTQHRQGRARPRPRRHREAEPARRLDARPGLGLRARARGALPRAFDHGTPRSAARRARGRCSPGEPERAGRWWWEQDTAKECGIHCCVELAGLEVATARRRRGRRRGGV